MLETLEVQIYLLKQMVENYKTQMVLWGQKKRKEKEDQSEFDRGFYEGLDFLGAKVLLRLSEIQEELKKVQENSNPKD